MAAEGIQKTFVTELTEVTTTQKEANLGTIRWAGPKCYKYVKLYNDTATVAGVAGDPVAYGTSTGWNDSTVVLDLSDADTKPIAAGQLLAAVVGTVDTAYYCWIQIKGGAVTTTAIGGTEVIGDALTLSTTDKTWTVGAAADDMIGAYLQNIAGLRIILDCPF